MVASPKGLGPEKDCPGKALQHVQRQTRPLAGGGAPQKKTVTVKQQQISGHEPQMGLDTKTY
jgi:hypothetical protein